MTATAFDVALAGTRSGVLAAEAAAVPSERETTWRVLWTHSHCEPLVCEQLSAKGFHVMIE